MIIDSNRLYINITDGWTLTGLGETCEGRMGLHQWIHLLTVLPAQVLIKPITQHIDSNGKKKRTTTQKDATEDRF